MVLSNDIDLLHPPAELEKRKHKLKRLVQSPNSFFMDVKCQGCFNITTVFSHSQTVVVCGSCQTVLCQPTGGRARLTEGCSFRKKGDWLFSFSVIIVCDQVIEHYGNQLAALCVNWATSAFSNLIPLLVSNYATLLFLRGKYYIKASYLTRFWSEDIA